jgi:integral membrane protein
METADATQQAAPANPVRLLRTIALVEGVSFLILLGIAMPLKYAAGMPMAVKVCGWIHGVLFIALMVALVRTVRHARWPVGRAAMVFVGALLPFGPMVLERRMKQYQAEFAAREG